MYSDDDLQVVGRSFVEAIARERGTDPSDLLVSMASFVRMNKGSSKLLDDVLMDALRSRRTIHRDSPDSLIRDLIAYLVYTRREGSDDVQDELEHFVDRANRLGFEVRKT